MSFLITCFINKNLLFKVKNFTFAISANSGKQLSTLFFPDFYCLSNFIGKNELKHKLQPGVSA